MPLQTHHDMSLPQEKTTSVSKVDIPPPSLHPMPTEIRRISQIDFQYPGPYLIPRRLRTCSNSAHNHIHFGAIRVLPGSNPSTDPPR